MEIVKVDGWELVLDEIELTTLKPIPRVAQEDPAGLDALPHSLPVISKGE
ncbi:MAG: hypothetical protein ACI97A_004286 [Planctomycetota bacterium]|jgi:hypothetical protein